MILQCHLVTVKLDRRKSKIYWASLQYNCDIVAPLGLIWGTNMRKENLSYSYILEIQNILKTYEISIYFLNDFV